MLLPPISRTKLTQSELVDFMDLLETLSAKKGELPSREALTTVLQTAQKVIQDLEFEVRHLQKQLFGRRSEKVPPGQGSLFVRTLEEVTKRTPEPEQKKRKKKKKKKKKKTERREPLKPTRTEIIEVAKEERPCPECGAPRCTIGHARSLVVEYIPAKIEVTDYSRETTACKPCEGEVARAPSPEANAREGSWPGPNLLAALIASSAESEGLLGLR